MFSEQNFVLASYIVETKLKQLDSFTYYLVPYHDLYNISPNWNASFKHFGKEKYSKVIS